MASFSMASLSNSGPLEMVTSVVVAVKHGQSSRRAARWADEHLSPLCQRVVLVHVMPRVSFIPTPFGEMIPIQKMQKEVVEMYTEDASSNAQEVFMPFRHLFARCHVETLILEGDNPAAALLDYVSETGAKNLVLGASSHWHCCIKKILHQDDVASNVLRLRLMTSQCNIIIVSKHKLTLKFSNLNAPSGVGSNNGNETTHCITHKDFAESEKSWILREQFLRGFLCGGSQRIKSAKSFSDFGQCSRSEIHETRSFRKSGYGPEAQEEVLKLRAELQNVLTMYNHVCEDLVHARKAIQSLSAECSTAEKKAQEALQREAKMKQLIEDLESMKQVQKPGNQFQVQESGNQFQVQEQGNQFQVQKPGNQFQVQELGNQFQVQEQGNQFSDESLDQRNKGSFASWGSIERSNIINALLSSGKSCKRYSKEEIEIATDNFSVLNKIGEGSYGDVYKCMLDRTEVAVKVLRQESNDKNEEFVREVEILSQLHHPNMVSLLGFCPESGSLVYEYMQNGSLDDLLFHKKDNFTPHLPWPARFRIIHEVSTALLFLHSSKPEPIVHRDLKPGNILLDNNLKSKIGDVGLAKLIADPVPDGLTEYKDTILAGTLFYMDPEYQRTGTVRPKSDLYALGVIMLQILTGRSPNGLLVRVEKAIESGLVRDLLDGSVRDWPVRQAEKLARLALRCCRLRCRDRPDLETEFLPELEAVLRRARVGGFEPVPVPVPVPRHFICPILKELMEDPYMAGDGYTYEHKAIKAWLEKTDFSPITRHKLKDISIIPNHSLRSAIQEWKSSMQI